VNRWTQTLTVAAAALAAAVVGAPTGFAQTATDSGGAVVQRAESVSTRVVNLRVGQHALFDRVVIDIRGPLPSRTLQYFRRLRYASSGYPVPLRGRRFLDISLFPAWTTRHPWSGREVYRGPQLQQYSMPTLRGVALVDDFEGYVGFGIALRRHVHYSVTVLHRPNRIVIDLPH
jgi:hypothetical protein